MGRKRPGPERFVPSLVLKKMKCEANGVFWFLKKNRSAVNVKLKNRNFKQINAKYCNKYSNEMSLDARKPVFGVSDQVRHKPACTSSEKS